MAELKKKIFVLKVSTKFMKTHSKSGDETGFVEKILNGSKIHTIRENWQYWYQVVKEVNEGNAVLQIRYWKDVPYRSPQETFYELDKLGFELGLFDIRNNVVEILSYEPDSKVCLFHHHGYQDLPIVANNDGLITEDFKEWFKDASVDYKAIIHFTDLRYAN
jgi:hypothetical protein